MTDVIAKPQQLSLAALFFKFLKFGFLAFGGPVAQIAMIRQALVEDEGWIDPARFNRLLAVMQILPGPEAHELCVHMGMVARGRIGGLLAGLGFMLPGFVLMLGIGILYEEWIANQPALMPLLLGIQIAVIAIIVRAVQRIGSHILEDRLLWLLAILAFGATMAGVPFWIPLIFSGLAYAMGERLISPWGMVLAIAFGTVLWLTMYDRAISIQATAAAPSALALFVAGLKGGLLTFGGAYTAIPYVRNDTVGRGWIEDSVFLDGVALAGILPAPLVIFVTFVGYVIGGWAGAIAITLGMFLPAFAFSLLLFERLEAIVEKESLHRILNGVAAAVVGIIAATSLQLGHATAERADNLLLAGAIFSAVLVTIMMFKRPWVMPLTLVAAGIAGAAFGH